MTEFSQLQLPQKIMSQSMQQYCSCRVGALGTVKVQVEVIDQSRRITEHLRKVGQLIHHHNPLQDDPRSAEDVWSLAVREEKETPLIKNLPTFILKLGKINTGPN